MRLHFIVNEFAGSGKSKKLWARLEKQLGIPYELHKTQYAQHAVQIAQQLAEQTAGTGEKICLIGIGGDGTIHEIINGAGHFQHVVIGAIGGGSGNDFTRYFKTFRNAEQIMQFWVTQQSEAHDYGILTVNHTERRFVNSSGIGFDAFVAITANESNLKRQLNQIGLGKLSYVFYVMKGLFQFQPFDLTVSHDGEEKVYRKVWFATVSNQPFFGGGMNLTPMSNTQDGELEMTIVSDLSKWKFLSLFGTVFFAKHTELREVHQLSGQQFLVSCDTPVVCHADGEKLPLPDGPLQFTFSVKQKAWNLAHIKV